MSQFRNLVFEGGGVKGIAYAGAVAVLESKAIMPDIRRVAGTSAGAITATLLAVGVRSNDVAEILSGTNFRSFMDDSLGPLRDSKRLLTKYGWFKGKAFSQWIKRQLYAFAGNPDLDFAGLKRLADERPGEFRELFVVGSNLSTQLEQVFCAENTPSMPIWKAVRISMSIPLFFASVRHGGEVFVDGGVVWNYPIGLYDDTKYNPVSGAATAPGYTTTYGSTHVYNKETLGFRVDTKDEIKAERDSWKSPPKSVDNIFDYVKVLIGFMMEAANRAHLHKDDWDRTVFIDALGVKTTDFDLNDSQVDALVKSGRDGAKAYFDWFENPNEQPLNRV